MSEFESEVLVRCPLAKVFDFFSRPENLPKLSPETMPIEVVSAPEVIAPDSSIKIKVRQWGIPQQIEARVVEFQPPMGFADEQVKGPFARWRHTHRFETVDAETTRVIDVILFEPPTGLLAMLLSENKILEHLEEVFEERGRMLREILEGDGNPASERVS